MTKRWYRGSETCCRIGRHLPKNLCHFVILSQGTYHISDPLALKNPRGGHVRKIGANPRTNLFIPNPGICHWPLFDEAENLVIEAAGKCNCSVMDGWSHFRFGTLKNITLNGITIDYKRRPTIKGKYAWGAKLCWVCIFTDKEDGCNTTQMVFAYLWCSTKRKFLYRWGGPIMRKMEFSWPPILAFYGKNI